MDAAGSWDSPTPMRTLRRPLSTSDRQSLVSSCETSSEGIDDLDAHAVSQTAPQMRCGTLLLDVAYDLEDGCRSAAPKRRGRHSAATTPRHDGHSEILPSSSGHPTLTSGRHPSPLDFRARPKQSGFSWSTDAVQFGQCSLEERPGPLRWPEAQKLPGQVGWPNPMGLVPLRPPVPAVLSTPSTLLAIDLWSTSSGGGSPLVDWRADFTPRAALEVSGPLQEPSPLLRANA